MNRLCIIHIMVISKYYSSVDYLSSRNSMIPFKKFAPKFPVNCGVPLLVAKIPSINDDAHPLRILASLLSLRNIVLNLAISGALHYKI